MPNHVKNIIIFENCSEERLAEILQAIRSEESPIDFEKIIPMPENIYRGDLGIEEEKRYGENNWYDWSRKNWGTKWNAYDVDDVDGCKIGFSSAWSAPHPVIKALAKRFPDVYILHKWADEDIGSNCGLRTYEDGELAGEMYPDGDKEAMDFAMSVWGYTPEDLRLVLKEDGSGYKYKED